MEEEIARILYINIKKENDINEQFIEKIISIVIDYLDIKKYSGKYNITKLNRFNEGSYDYSNQIIDINNRIFCTKESHRKKYINLLQTLLHELIHAKQYGNIFEINNAENLIIYSEIGYDLNYRENVLKTKYSRKEMTSYSSLINKYYLYSPLERLAEIDSLNYMIRVLSILEYNKELEKTKKDYIYSYLRGYEEKLNKIVPPTPFFLNKIGCNMFLDNIYCLSQDEEDMAKFRLGLECSDEIYNKFKTIYKRKVKKK